MNNIEQFIINNNLSLIIEEIHTHIKSFVSEYDLDFEIYEDKLFISILLSLPSNETFEIGRKIFREWSLTKNSHFIKYVNVVTKSNIDRVKTKNRKEIDILKNSATYHLAVEDILEEMVGSFTISSGYIRKTEEWDWDLMEDEDVIIPYVLTDTGKAFLKGVIESYINFGIYRFNEELSIGETYNT